MKYPVRLFLYQPKNKEIEAVARWATGTLNKDTIVGVFLCTSYIF